MVRWRPAAIASRTSCGPCASMTAVAAVVHQHDHRGRAAGAGELLHDGGRRGEVRTAAAHVRRAGEPEDAGLAERLELSPGVAPVAVDGGGAGLDDVVDARARAQIR